MTEPAVVLYVLRHGRTALNAAGVLRGHLDPPLDDVGEAEAAALAEAFRGVRLVAVVTSPLLRARQTAIPLADATGAMLHVDEGLIDRDWGPFAGQARDEVEARFGSLDAAPGVEPADAFLARTVAAVGAAAQRWAPGPPALVAHDAVNRAVLAALVPGAGHGQALGQRTGCWNRLERHSSGWAAPIVDAVPDDGHRP